MKHVLLMLAFLAVASSPVASADTHTRTMECVGPVPVLCAGYEDHATGTGACNGSYADQRTYTVVIVWVTNSCTDGKNDTQLRVGNAIPLWWGDHNTPSDPSGSCRVSGLVYAPIAEIDAYDIACPAGIQPGFWEPDGSQILP